MKASTTSLVAACVMAAMSTVAIFQHYSGLGGVLGLFAVYFLVRAEVLHRSDL